MTVPMLDEMIQLSAANGAREVVIGMAHRGRLNVLAHNLGRAYETIWREFEGASSIEAVTTIPQGGTGDVKYHHGAQGTYQLPNDSVGDRAPGVQPVAPRVRLAGRRRRHPRGPDLAPGPARAHRQQRRDPDHPPRRRRLPGPGRGGGDAQPAGARRLPGRRLAAPDPEQPGRLHHRPGGGAVHPLGLGPREGLRRPDHPRQRRRRRGLRRRRAARLRVPPGVRPRRRHRPHRLPPLRPQRGRRARLHAARDGRQDQEQDAGARDLRRRAGQAGRDHAGGVRRDRQGDLGRHGRAPSPAQGGALARRRPSSRRAATSSTAPPRPRSRPRCRPTGCRGSTTTCCTSPRASTSIPSCSSSSSAGARRSARRAGSTGPTRRRSPSPRC